MKKNDGNKDQAYLEEANRYANEGKYIEAFKKFIKYKELSRLNKFPPSLSTNDKNNIILTLENMHIHPYFLLISTFKEIAESNNTKELLNLLSTSFELIKELYAEDQISLLKKLFNGEISLGRLFNADWKTLSNELPVYNHASLVIKIFSHLKYLDSTFNKDDPTYSQYKNMYINAVILTIEKDLMFHEKFYNRDSKNLIKRCDDALKLLDDEIPDIYYLRGRINFADAQNPYRPADLIECWYKQAIADFDKAIQFSPQHDEIYVYRGYAHFELSEYEQALSDFNQAIACQPANKNAYNNRGYLYFTQKNYQAALDDFNQAILLDASYSNARENLALVYSALAQEQAPLVSNEAVTPSYFNKEEYIKAFNRQAKPFSLKSSKVTYFATNTAQTCFIENKKPDIDNSATAESAIQMHNYL